jgi:hypothetical protein
MGLKIQETTGNCIRCGRYALLGNGICQECWDNPNRRKDNKEDIRLCSSGMKRLDIELTRYHIRALGKQKNIRQSALYQMLKEELSKLGYWKNRSRGNPSKGFQVMRSRRRNNANE